MEDYKKLKMKCEADREISAEVIDQFLLYYAGERKRLSPEADRQLKKYRHVTRTFEPSWTAMLKSQYIAHRIFKQDGLIKKYLQHSEVNLLPLSQLEYLRRQSATAWRFTFSMIVENPAKDFYEMVDIFTDESFLVYSPGMTSQKQESSGLIWFNLIGFNGACWQTYGPIMHYVSFLPDDIFLFATELDPMLYDDEEVAEYIQENPVPFMMLLSGSRFPVTVHGEDLICLNYSEDHDMVINTDQLSKYFTAESAGDVVRFELQGWETFPHFSTLYYDKQNDLLLRSAMTSRGFDALTNKLISLGYNLVREPDSVVSLQMVSTGGNILQKKIVLNPYEKLFAPPKDDKQNPELVKLNEALQMMMPDLNADITPDFEAISEKCGMMVEDLIRLYDQIIETRDRTTGKNSFS